MLCQFQDLSKIIYMPPCQLSIDTMCLKTLRTILNSPLNAVKYAKRRKNMSEVLQILLLTWTIVGISLFAVSVRIFDLLVSFAVGVIGFVAGFFLSMFFGYLITRVMNILGGRGKFIDGLITISYSLFPISIGVVITSLLALIHPALGILGFVAIAIQTSLSISLYFRLIKELFRVNIITTLVGFFIIMYVIMASVYLTVSLSSTDLYEIFGQMMIPLFGI